MIPNTSQVTEHSGIKVGHMFTIPTRYFGKDCTTLYKVQGFQIKEDKIQIVYCSKIDKRTHKIPNKAPLLEGFKLEFVQKYINSYIL